jgi:hypothetical protein
LTSVNRPEALSGEVRAWRNSVFSAPAPGDILSVMIVAIAPATASPGPRVHPIRTRACANKGRKWDVKG